VGNHRQVNTGEHALPCAVVDHPAIRCRGGASAPSAKRSGHAVPWAATPDRRARLCELLRTGTLDCSALTGEARAMNTFFILLIIAVAALIIIMDLGHR
jgi:hypothetical protein